MRQASHLGRVVRGAFGTRGAPLDADGGGAPGRPRASVALLAPPRRASLLIAALSLCAALVFAAVALAAVPVISGTMPTQIRTTGAVLNALVNPGGQPTTYHFDYGTTLAYGQSTPESNPIGSDSSDHPISKAISGLSPGTTYHFRVVATNADGSTTGPDTTFSTYSLPPSFDPCPNDILRTGPSGRLPDCRAYEQASPVSKYGSDAQGQRNDVQASTSGDAITFVSHTGVPGGVGGQNWPFFIAQRGATGWSSAGILPPAAMGDRVFMAGWTPDLSLTFTDAINYRAPQGDGPAFVLRDSATGTYSQVHTYTSGGPTQRSTLVGASADGSKVYFENNNVKLTPDATAGRVNLYVWDRDTNAITLVGVLPDSACGTPPCPAPGSFAAPWDWMTLQGPAAGGIKRGYFTQYNHVVSDSGDQIFWSARNSGQLYVRRNAAGSSPSTDWVNESERSSADPNGTQPAIFWTATPSGSKAFFTSCEQLTGDSTAHSIGPECTGAASGEGQDLYAYDSASGGLTDLTVDGADPEGADVQGVLGASDSGDYVYFVANGDLDGPGGATLADCVWNPGAITWSGICNLYQWHAGATSFVARIDGHEDSANWLATNIVSSPNGITSRVSADGQTLLFASERQLADYNNTPPEEAGPEPCGNATGADIPEPCRELYRFHSGEPLTCPSCNPTGAPPTGSASLTDIDTGSALGIPQDGNVVTRNLSVNGNRLFFESIDKLVEVDTNGVQDVYEWEAENSGSCRSDEANGGCLYLLSAGSGPVPSFFGDASVSGDDAFIFTRDQLVPQDQDGLQDVYDVKVGGGLVSQHAAEPPGCAGESCRNAGTSPSGVPGAGTAVFSGPGNPPAKHRKARKHRKKRKQHKRHRARKYARANTHAGGSK